MSLLKTLKGQILVLSALCMVAALLVLTLVNYFSARGQAQVSLAEEGLATAKSHAETIEEWARGKSAIIAASVTAFEEPEPAKPLAMLRDAGKFSTAYFGYADKKYVFSETRNLPADYDPTARPWYKQAAQAGTSVVTPPYISAARSRRKRCARSRPNATGSRPAAWAAWAARPRRNQASIRVNWLRSISERRRSPHRSSTRSWAREALPRYSSASTRECRPWNCW